MLIGWDRAYKTGDSISRNKYLWGNHNIMINFIIIKTIDFLCCGFWTLLLYRLSSYCPLYSVLWSQLVMIRLPKSWEAHGKAWKLDQVIKFDQIYYAYRCLFSGYGCVDIIDTFNNIQKFCFSDQIKVLCSKCSSMLLPHMIVLTVYLWRIALGLLLSSFLD